VSSLYNPRLPVSLPTPNPQDFQRLFGASGIAQLQNALASTANARLAMEEAALAAAKVINSLPAPDFMDRFLVGIRDVSRLVSQLPDVRVLAAQFEAFEEENGAIRQAGLADLVNPLPAYLFRGVRRVDQRVRTAWLTNQVLHFSRTDEFAEEIEHAFSGSVVLARRWPVIAEALDAHRSRRYLLSIPPLLAQTEGVVGDALVLRGIVRPAAGKLYVLDSKGKRARDAKGKFIMISGAHDLANRSKQLDHETLQSVADYITTIFVGNRNPILHGRKPAYSSPKLSVQSLLALLFLAEAVSEFEASGFRPSKSP